ncbi:6-bladed beta-propeller [Rhodohalobacter sp. SW132]|uniref:6-bladed beta-propeller n=1 Tax=Rhodohalobacter sp. SW132 TaxID=2293433 RepID=UPI000E238642|nr:6-bladed beta-propeller [Rhodohalobacter sp. SW132]REL37775.1 6-bladed beta-propeller [Rhodohalobacter sp. SW132]
MRNHFNEERRERKYIFVVLFLVAVGCGTNENDDYAAVPGHVLEMEHIKIFSEEDHENADTIKLIKEQEFRDTEDVYFASVRGFITDESGRVYITDIAPGILTIHVFSPDGEYLTSLGRVGNGPGEFNSLCCLNIRSNRLYVVDKALARITVYSTDSLDLLETVSMDRNNLNSSGQIEGKRLLGHYFFDDETRLLAYITPQRAFEDTPATIHYFTADTAYQELS